MKANLLLFTRAKALRPALILGLVLAASSTRSMAQPLPVGTPSSGSTAQTAQGPTQQSQTGTGSEQVAAEDVINMEAVSVTGSNIRRMEQEKVLPVTVFNADAMVARNALTPVELLTALPQVTNIPANESTSGGASLRGDIATVNLRGIGAEGTLILLNGRRLVPHPITTGETFVNVNQLPTRGIDHIDVLRDGASSIYGSDAVAGVINYVTQKDFRGTELRFRYGFPEHGGGESVNGTLTYGLDFAGGKGRFLTTLDVVYRDALYLGEREFSANANHVANAPAPFNVAGSAFEATSATGLYPSFRVGAATGTSYFRPVNGNLTLTNTAPTRAANPEYYYNINQYTMGLPRTARANWYASMEYDLKNSITAFGDLSYYYSRTNLVRQGVPLNAPGADLPMVVSADNPWNPYGSQFFSPTGAPTASGTPRLVGTPQPITLLTETIRDIGTGEHVRVTDGIYRVVGGLRGKFGSTWSWETGVLYSRGRALDVSLNGVRESLLQSSLSRTNASAYNPFGYTFKVQNGAVVPDQPYTNPQSTTSAFVDVFRHEGYSSIGSIDLRTAGEVFSCAATRSQPRSARNSVANHSRTTSCPTPV